MNPQTDSRLIIGLSVIALALILFPVFATVQSGGGPSSQSLNFIRQAMPVLLADASDYDDRLPGQEWQRLVPVIADQPPQEFNFQFARIAMNRDVAG